MLGVSLKTVSLLLLITKRQGLLNLRKGILEKTCPRWIERIAIEYSKKKKKFKARSKLPFNKDNLKKKKYSQYFSDDNCKS